MDSNQALYKVVTRANGWFFVWADSFEDAGKLALKHLCTSKDSDSSKWTPPDDIKSISVHVERHSVVINHRS